MKPAFFCFTKRISRKKNTERGVTLVEVLVGTFIFLIIAVGLYQGYVSVLSVIQAAKQKTTATLLANEQIELLHNLSYENVGVTGAIPDGVVPFTQDVLRNNATYTIETTIRNIDDPFDGTIGGMPNDTAPADYKLAEVEITCASCQNFPAQIFTTSIAPEGLENTTGNGALFVEVLNASGLPVTAADVHVENNATATPIIINDVTAANGMLQLVDVPPGVQVYEVTISKTGYSQAQTYTPGAPGNPNPSKPHATVASGTVTTISFAIDEEATVDFRTADAMCNAIGNVDFDMRGSKLIGTSPNVYKYDQSHVTGAGGTLSLTGIEWDTYELTVTDTSYDLAGTVPFLPLSVTPGATEDVLFVLEASDPNAFLVSIIDGGTGLPLTDAQVTLSATSTGFNETLLTSRGYHRQTDWSGGPGQESFTDPTRYSSDDGNIEGNLPPGDVKLSDILGLFASSGELTSSTFDAGSTSTTYHLMSWQPEAQPPETGVDPVRFQLATNNDDTTWDYKGPDGTGVTYYTLSDTTVHSAHDNTRYLRYKLLLSTASTTYTPSLSDIAVTYGSECVPFGQVFFNGLTSGSYTVSVSKTGYTPFSQDVNLTSSWQSLSVTLVPE